MKIKPLQAVAVLGFLALVAGCSEEKVPEPTEENCSPEMYEETIASLSLESKRNEFRAACDSFLAARKMTKWQFRKSPKDDY